MNSTTHEFVHALVPMESVKWVQQAIIACVTQVTTGLVQIVFLTFHRLHVRPNNADTTKIASWQVTLLHASASTATLAHLAILQLHVQLKYAAIIEVAL